MKIALFLTTLCAVALLNGCSTNRGGTTDEYDTASGPAGTVHETEPEVTEPSLPQDPNMGPPVPPPSQPPDSGPQMPPP